MTLPSELGFTSFLQYAPRGFTKVSIGSQAVMRAIKSDGTLGSGRRAIDYAAQRMREESAKGPVLQACLGPGVALVPMPRRAPLVTGNALWPPKRLCDAMVAEGLAIAVLPILKRIHAVQKSATAAAGQRPDAATHYDSIEVEAVSPKMLAGVNAITLVDDVITRGATMLAAFARVREVLADVPICCFALIRTISHGEVDEILDPVSGKIQRRDERGNSLKREP